MFEPGHEGVFWRDLVSFTWNIHTFEGNRQIKEALERTVPGNEPVPGTWLPYKNDGSGSEGHFTFENNRFRGRGYLRVNPSGKALTCMTAAQELCGFEEKTGRHNSRPHGVVPGRFGVPEAWHGAANKCPDTSWLERKEHEAATMGLEEQPYVLVIGGGQGGVALGARLRRLEVPHIVIDKWDRPGDNWRNRYKSLCLHDPIWYDHFPYIPFPDHWPVFTPKDMLGDWIEFYTKVMNINYWGRTECKHASFDGGRKSWEVQVVRDGKSFVLRPTHVVFATGLSGFPNMPQFPGQESFAGPIWHSSKFPGADGFKGKKAVVIGSNNSAHDISEELHHAGADVTMLQRSSTHIITSDTLMSTLLAPLYCEDAAARGVGTNDADLQFSGIPFKMLPDMHREAVKVQKEKDGPLLERLRQAGFLLDSGEDDSGLFCKYLRRGSGYYIDVGASELIANGSVKIKSGAQVAKLRPRAVELQSGEVLEADVLVCATGYGNMNEWVRALVDEQTQRKVGNCWGLGSGTTKDPGPWEGELRNMWKPTRQENLWFHGGNLHQSRQHSLFLGLQLKARFEGIETPVYPAPVAHHSSGGYSK